MDGRKLKCMYIFDLICSQNTSKIPSWPNPALDTFGQLVHVGQLHICVYTHPQTQKRLLWALGIAHSKVTVWWSLISKVNHFS